MIKLHHIRTSNYLSQQTFIAISCLCGMQPVLHVLIIFVERFNYMYTDICTLCITFQQL